MRHTLRSLLVIAVLGFGTLPAIQPLFSGQLFGADGLLHFHRLVQLERAVRHGILYPRWLPDLGYGFGFPLFNYYAPLSYYLLLPMRWLGFSAQTVLLIGFAGALWALAIAVYLWGRDLFGERAGLVGALATIYAPSILNDVYQRGALPSVWALVWLVLSAWALQRLARQPNARFFFATALGVMALLLTHNITSLIGLPLLTAYVLFLGILHGFRRCLRPLFATALGMGLAAGFWVPALFEQNYVQIHQLYLPAGFDYHYNFISWNQLLVAPSPVDPARVNPPSTLGLGWIQVTLMVACWWPVGTALLREVRAHRWALSVAAVGLTAMALPISLPVWDHIPILRFVQFPWRFLAIVTPIVAVLGGAGAEYLLGRRGWGLLVLVAAIILFAMTWLFPTFWPPQTSPEPPDQIRFEAKTGALGATSAGDYLPRWVQELPEPDTLLPLYEAAAPDYIIPRLDPTCLPAGARVLEAYYGLTETRLTIESAQPFRLRLFWYFFPGWQGWLDEEPLPLMPDGPHGLVAADIPPGRHQVVITFGDTPLRRWASLLSYASSILLIFATFWAWRAREKAHRLAQPISERVPLRVLGACALLALSLTVVKTVYLDRYDNPFRRTLFDGRQVRGVDVPLEVNFGNQLVLMGYDLPRQVVRADESIEIALYWRVLSPVTADYSIGLHLVDERGIFYGQHDNQHPAYYYPTSRLRTDQYARDVHHLTPWEGTPPGLYTLLVLAYDQKGGYRLDLRDPAGNPLGTTVYPLARVEILRPSRHPSVEQLPVRQRLDADMGGGLRLIGSGPLPERIEVGQSFQLTLFWQALRQPAAAYRARLRLSSTDGTVAAEAIWSPGRANYPTSSWQQEEIIRDTQVILIPVALSSAPDVPVSAGTYELHLDLLDDEGNPISDGVDLGRIPVTTPERTFTPPSVPFPAEFHLGEMATLLGYDPLPSTLRAGEVFTVTLYWRADAFVGLSYIVFVHLLGPDGRIYAQRDSVPVGWTRPTAGWFPGEFIRDEYQLTVDPAASPGEYHLAVGWYDPTTGQRVAVLDASGVPLGDHILLPAVIGVRE